MITIIAISLYCFFYLLSYWMLRIDHESEEKIYTQGDRLLTIAISLGSILTVLYILIYTWIKKIHATGYWERPVKLEKKENKK